MSNPSAWTVLFIADIVGKPGLDVVASLLPRLKEENRPDFIIANGENAAENGRGITEAAANLCFELGVDVITGGNHIWENADIYHIWKRKENRILRPANFPRPNPGTGYTIVELTDQSRAAVINLQGRTFMMTIDCPFKAADDIVRRLEDKADFAIVDFHAEATAEKIALGWHLDGRVSAIIGTHTHVQTADERVLPGGTAYLTDAGMTGPVDSVIGMRKDTAVKRFVRQTPMRLEPAASKAQFCGVIIEIDKATAKAASIKRLCLQH